MCKIAPSPLSSPEQEKSIVAASGFLQLLDPDVTTFHFQIYSDRKGRKSSKSLEGNLFKLGDELILLNQDNYAIAVCINEIGSGLARHSKNVSRIRAIFVDDDTPRSQPREDFPLEPSIVVESSPDKYHYYWLCEGLPIDKFQPIQKALVSKYGHDNKVTAPNAVMRLPGFFHQKRAKFQTQVIYANPYRYSAAEITKAFPPILEEPDSIYYRTKLVTADRVKLKDKGLYEAKAVAWTMRGKNRITIRYLVTSDTGKHFLDEYIQVKRCSKTGLMSVGFDSRPYNDLITLCPGVQLDFNKLPLSVIDEYFNKQLEVMVTTVTRKPDPSRPGKFLPRPPASYYSKVEGIYSVK